MRAFLFWRPVVDESGYMVRSSGIFLVRWHGILQIFCRNSSLVDLRHHINNGYEDLEPLIHHYWSSTCIPMALFDLKYMFC